MIRAVVIAALVLASLPAAAARHAVVILPPEAGGDAADLALVMQTRAAELLARSGGFDEIHVKQILHAAVLAGVSRAELAEPAGADAVTRRLGAERGVRSTLARSGSDWVLTYSRVEPGAKDGKSSTRTARLPGPPARAVEEGALILARAAAGDDKLAGSPPRTISDAAMTAYATCYAILVAQPLALENPLIIERPVLERAVAACRNAIGADPKFLDAQAALGLALALAGKDDEAVQVLAAVKEGDAYLPFYWLARYWLVTRYQSADAGATALRKAIEAHPYFLLAYGYLAEHETTMHHDDAALAAWRAYEAELPRSAHVRDGVSHALAHLGKNDEAIAEAAAVAKELPDDDEAQLELASRQLDGNHVDDAIKTLEPLAGKPRVRSEVLLRLGYAYARKGNTGAAAANLKRAEDASQRPEDWRTRARARLDRGVLLVKNGQVDEGQALLVSAKHAGLERFIEAQKDLGLKQMIADAEVAQRDKKVEEFKVQQPPEVSPFPLDVTGVIDPAGPRLPKPKMFEVLEF